METKKDIFLTVRTRGPHAFKKFLLSLRQSGHEDIANDLENVEINSNGLEKEVIPKLDDLRLRDNYKGNYADEEYEDYDEDE